MANETNKRDFLFPRKKLDLLRIFFLVGVSNGRLLLLLTRQQMADRYSSFYSLLSWTFFSSSSSSTSISLFLKERLFLISRWGSRCLFTWIRRKEIRKIYFFCFSLWYSFGPFGLSTTPSKAISFDFHSFKWTGGTSFHLSSPTFRRL
jgi:hypothetical protein